VTSLAQPDLYKRRRELAGLNVLSPCRQARPSDMRRYIVRTEARTPRLLRPRQTRGLAVAPVVVTDLSAAAVVGLEQRSFRELVRDLKIPHVRRGQRILVDVEVLREVLASASTSEVDDAPAGTEDADDQQGPTASELLQRLGRTRVVRVRG
jgi:hypothetical protein